MKKTMLAILTVLMMFSMTACSNGEEIFRFLRKNPDGYDDFRYRDSIKMGKPVIYLYPEEAKEVTVELDLKGELSTTYPKYENGWRVFARPDGSLTDLKTGKEYSYLFWEGYAEADWDLSQGYVVKGGDTADFLQETLSKMGLTLKEYNEFIVYWLPFMEGNKYNLITFQNERYTDLAKLNVSPKPDSVLRVYMVYKPLEEPIEIEEPEISGFERRGFTLVEWGATALERQACDDR